MDFQCRSKAKIFSGKQSRAIGFCLPKGFHPRVSPVCWYGLKSHYTFYSVGAVKETVHKALQPRT